MTPAMQSAQDVTFIAASNLAAMKAVFEPTLDGKRVLIELAEELRAMSQIPRSDEVEATVGRVA